MKSIALVHTVESVATSFARELKNIIDEEIKIHNIWDDFLANNPNEIGEFTINNRNRLFNDIKSAEMTGADVIVITCSTLTPIVKMIRPFIKVPIVAIDDAMGEMAVMCGKKILVFATAESTIKPTKEKLMEEALRKNIEIIVEDLVCTPAFHALKAMEMDNHDNLIKEMAKDISGYDCIVLAQASMAHLELDISEICKCRVLSSPKLCMEQVKKIIDSIDRKEGEL